MSADPRRLDADPTALASPAVPSEGVVDAESTAVGRTVRRYVDGLTAGDVEVATEAAVAVAQLDAPVGEVLTGLADAIERDRVLDARALRWQLRDRYRRRRPMERARLDQARLARRFDLASHPALGRLREEHGRLETARSAVLTDALTVFGGPSLSRERRRELRNDAARLAARESTYHDLGERAATTLEGADLPAAVSLLAARPVDERVVVGEESAIELAIGNVGDGTAAGVTATVEGDLGVDDPTVEVGDLARTTVATATVPLDAAVVGGTYEFTVEVTSEQAGEDRAAFDVVASETPLSIAAAYDEDGDGRLDTREVQQAIADHNREESVPGFDDRPLTAEELRRLLVLWARDQPV